MTPSRRAGCGKSACPVRGGGGRRRSDGEASEAPSTERDGNRWAAPVHHRADPRPDRRTHKAPFSTFWYAWSHLGDAGPVPIRYRKCTLGSETFSHLMTWQSCTFACDAICADLESITTSLIFQRERCKSNVHVLNEPNDTNDGIGCLRKRSTSLRLPTRALLQSGAPFPSSWSDRVSNDPSLE
jgi:hypothetical protein